MKHKWGFGKMNKQQTNEYLRLGIQISEMFGGIRRRKNDMWRLNNERTTLGQENGRIEKKITELTKQQHRLLGRSWIELEEEKAKKEEESS